MEFAGIGAYGAVAMAARVFRNLKVRGANAYRLRIGSGRKVERMPKAVFRLYPVLRNELMRSMTIVARGHRPVTTPAPAVELLLHDVAVRAGLGITAQIGAALGVI